MSVAVRDLKAQLSSVLARAQKGEVIEVTSHRRPVARIIGIPQADEKDIQQLVNAGLVSLPHQQLDLGKPLKISEKGTPVSRMILEDRL